LFFFFLFAAFCGHFPLKHLFFPQIQRKQSPKKEPAMKNSVIYRPPYYNLPVLGLSAALTLAGCAPITGPSVDKPPVEQPVHEHDFVESSRTPAVETIGDWSKWETLVEESENEDGSDGIGVRYGKGTTRQDITSTCRVDGTTKTDFGVVVSTREWDKSKLIGEQPENADLRDTSLVIPAGQRLNEEGQLVDWNGTVVEPEYGLHESIRAGEVKKWVATGGEGFAVPQYKKWEIEQKARYDQNNNIHPDEADRKWERTATPEADLDIIWVNGNNGNNGWGAWAPVGEASNDYTNAPTDGITGVGIDGTTITIPGTQKYKTQTIQQIRTGNYEITHTPVPAGVEGSTLNTKTAFVDITNQQQNVQLSGHNPVHNVNTLGQIGNGGNYVYGYTDAFGANAMVGGMLTGYANQASHLEKFFKETTGDTDLFGAGGSLTDIEKSIREVSNIKPGEFLGLLDDQEAAVLSFLGLNTLTIKVLWDGYEAGHYIMTRDWRTEDQSDSGSAAANAFDGLPKLDAAAAAAGLSYNTAYPWNAIQGGTSIPNHGDLEGVVSSLGDALVAAGVSHLQANGITGDQLENMVRQYEVPPVI
jgi:hypothetical protein